MNDDDTEDGRTERRGVTPFYQTLLKRLAAVAVALGTTSTASAAEQLASIPLEIAEGLVDATELDEWDVRDRHRLLGLMAKDPRSAVRARVALRLGREVKLADAGERLLDRLALDPSARVRDAVLRALELLVPQLTALERWSLVGRWATSSRSEHRLLTAQVLPQRFPLLWDDDILSLLALDPSSAVRHAARRAAEARGIAAP